MSLKGVTWIYRLSLFLLVIFIIVMPRGCSSLYSDGGYDEAGKLGVTLQGEQSISESMKSKVLSEYARVKVFTAERVKKDYGFVVYEDYKIDLNLTVAGTYKPPENTYLSISAPGNIISANADDIEGNQAKWLLKLDQAQEMRVSFRDLRWWAILIFVILILLAVFLRVIIWNEKRKEK